MVRYYVTQNTTQTKLRQINMGFSSFICFNKSKEGLVECLTSKNIVLKTLNI